MRSILVVGGAGYIGSHMVKLLLARGYRVVTLDNLSTGHRDAVTGGAFVHGSLAERAVVKGLFEDRELDAVMHFASSCSVEESMTNPRKYYWNNVHQTRCLLDAMLAGGVRRIIYSSSAAVYGEPRADVIAEDHPRDPVNPYGRTKLIVEQLLREYGRLHGLRSTCLRYFNAAGADPAGHLDERHDPETHLIPRVLRAAAGRLSASLSLFGQDYDTPDGTAVRDYVHVSDLCDAHLLALERLLSGERSAAFNLGTGIGASVREIVALAGRITGRDVPVRIQGRRRGDPARLVADPSKALRELGWRPKRNLASIIRDAWRWDQRECPAGGGDRGPCRVDAGRRRMSM